MLSPAAPHLLPLLATRTHVWKLQGPARLERRQGPRHLQQEAADDYRYACGPLADGRWRPAVVARASLGARRAPRTVLLLTLPRHSARHSAGLVLLVSLFIFFSVEQSLIAGNLAASRAALAQNNAIRSSNERLEQAKGELQDEEDECVCVCVCVCNVPAPPGPFHRRPSTAIVRDAAVPGLRSAPTHAPPPLADW